MQDAEFTDLDRAIRALFPAPVEVRQAVPAPDIDVPVLADEEGTTRAMVEERRLQFRLGRHLAREALAALGVPPAPIPADGEGAPLWPAGVVGAITHCRALVVAVVARGSDVAGLGVDAELASRRTPRRTLRRVVCTPAELDAMSALSDSEDPAWPLVIFSAKESIYKALRLPRAAAPGFRDVQIQLDVDRGSYTVVPVDSGAHWSEAVGRISGRFLRTPTLVVTSAYALT